MKRSRKKTRSDVAAAGTTVESDKAESIAPEGEEADIFRKISEPSTEGRFSLDGVRVLEAIGVFIGAAELVWLVLRQFLHVI